MIILISLTKHTKISELSLSDKSKVYSLTLQDLDGRTVVFDCHDLKAALTLQAGLEALLIHTIV